MIYLSQIKVSKGELLSTANSGKPRVWKEREEEEMGGRKNSIFVVNICWFDSDANGYSTDF